MSIADEIDSFLNDYECEGEEAETFTNMLKRASKELRALMADGDTLLQVIADKNHNASVMRKHIADLEKKKEPVIVDIQVPLL